MSAWPSLRSAAPVTLFRLSVLYRYTYFLKALNLDAAVGGGEGHMVRALLLYVKRLRWLSSCCISGLAFHTTTQQLTFDPVAGESEQQLSFTNRTGVHEPLSPENRPCVYQCAIDLLAGRCVCLHTVHTLDLLQRGESPQFFKYVIFSAQT